MPTYEIVMDFPAGRGISDTSGFVDALREFAAPRITVTIEATSKRAAAKLLAESTEHYADQHSNGRNRWSADWYAERLTALRGKRAIRAAELIGV
ncbi:hypothetical protein GCM10025867_51500 (plasmid) [Frondihabitans sucicola]|uniref:Uncharacterized protein n=1 Tax=Frondihabitans sucicola TaxID=1268041 RepID=A0ABM8GV43_9MICO|nr:hypothetical protein [Frondihabitans sucicola]BDZ52342.1 hypothetical protein GCM10025867_45830 [Frondihabitans sucicola]BDZ52909.1 hypothetical protein GCM10025867_51500 [Frondihabitans sucicola]